MRPTPEQPVRYPSDDSDNARWLEFEHRPGDIVISTRSKSGTTWMQMISALLVFETEELPAPLWELSPWLDWKIEPIEDVNDRLEAQAHRRFIKTHTPLNGLPLDPTVSYIVVARHPLDAAVSLYHQGNNLDRRKLAELTGQVHAPDSEARPQLEQWMQRWIDWDGRAEEELDSLPGFMMHLSDAWTRRHEGNVILVHYADLLADLEVQMRRLAGFLGISISDDLWPSLVEAATFERMKSRAEDVAPANAGILKDTQRFFRRGTSGAASETLSNAYLEKYHERARALAPGELLEWLHR